MSMQNTIEQKLAERFKPQHLEVINESGNHNVPPGSESHFKVVIVTDDFESQSLINRHRLVNETLQEELNGKIHALALHTYTPGDWAEKGANAPDSPACRGGSKAG